MPESKTQRDVDPFVEPNSEVYEGAWVYEKADLLKSEPAQHYVVTKIVGGYARLEKDPWSEVRAVRTGNLEVIKR